MDEIITLSGAEYLEKSIQYRRGNGEENIGEKISSSQREAGKGKRVRQGALQEKCGI